MTSTIIARHMLTALKHLLTGDYVDQLEWACMLNDSGR